jgi:hypothetical protein
MKIMKKKLQTFLHVHNAWICEVYEKVNLIDIKMSYHIGIQCPDVNDPRTPKSFENDKSKHVTCHKWMFKKLNMFTKLKTQLKNKLELQHKLKFKSK